MDMNFDLKYNNKDILMLLLLLTAKECHAMGIVFDDDDYRGFLEALCEDIFENLKINNPHNEE